MAKGSGPWWNPVIISYKGRGNGPKTRMAATTIVIAAIGVLIAIFASGPIGIGLVIASVTIPLATWNNTRPRGNPPHGPGGP